MLDAETADQVIDDTLTLYRAHGVRLRRTVGPDSSPPDLRERLARRSFEDVERISSFSNK